MSMVCCLASKTLVALLALSSIHFVQRLSASDQGQSLSGISSTTRTEREDGSSARSTPHAVRCSQLDREFVSRFARNNTVLLTVGDSILVPMFAFSWMRNVMAAGINYWLIGAVDDESQSYLQYKGVKRCFSAPLGLPLQQHPDNAYLWGQNIWGQATWRKVFAVQQVVSMGFNVVLSDLDVVWFRNPLPYFLSHPQYDVMLSTDVIHSTNRRGDEGPEQVPDTMSALNTGTYFVRASPAGQRLMSSWLQRASLGGSDQDHFNRLVRGYYADIKLPPSSVCLHNKSWEAAALLCMNRSLVLASLTPATFANSYTYYVERLHTAKRVQPYSLHLVWSGYGLLSKRQRMRDIMRYHDRRSYYTRGNFLTIDIRVPQMPEGYNRWTDSASMVAFHMAAMRYQLAQLYHGFALALALNRTLVLPPLQCYCARHWHYLMACVIHGDVTTVFPYDCQLGDYLKPSKVVEGLLVAGRQLAVRERSFLGNPRTDVAIVRDGAVVELGGSSSSAAGGAAAGVGGGAGGGAQQQVARQAARHLAADAASTAAAAVTAAAGSAAASSTGPRQVGPFSSAWPVVKLPGGRLTDAQLLTALAGHDVQRRRLLHVAQPAELFSGFEDPALQQAFDAAMANLTSSWCCRTPAEVHQQNLSNSIPYSMTPAGLDTSVFSQWQPSPAVQQVQQAHQQALPGGDPAMLQGLAVAGGLAGHGDGAALGAGAGAGVGAGAGRVGPGMASSHLVLPAGGGMLPAHPVGPGAGMSEDDPRHKGRDPDDPYISIVGGGPYMDINRM